MTANTILIVEDEPAIREMVAMALERSGYQILQAATAEEAERVIANGLPTLILLEHSLPGWSIAPQLQHTGNRACRKTT